MNNDLLDLFLQDVNLPLDQGEEDGDLDFFGDEEQGNDFVQEDQQDVDDHDHDQNQDEQDDQDDQDDQDIILIFITAFLTLYQAARRLDNIRRPNPAIPFIRFNIDAYDDVMCERLFRFRADEIRDVAVALRMPDIFHLDNGSKVYSLEGLYVRKVRKHAQSDYVESATLDLPSMGTCSLSVGSYKVDTGQA
ncbi:hypothetical protein BGX31_001218 [Mortierella sp. GBA43]|nr:hypothetical protein BGX31_001218 [Mortierella sp. GBA43]